MTTENIKEIVTLILKSEIAKKRVQSVIDSIEDKPNGIMVYLSRGSVLGEAMSVIEVIKKCGLKIPEQLGNAVIYVTA